MEVKNNIPTFKTLYLVMGILNLVFSLFPLIYVFIGAFLSKAINNSNSFDREPMPFDPGMFMIAFGLILFVFIITLGILNLFVSKSLNETRNYNFVFAMAIINCIFGGVLGILLGVFTLVEISKPYAKALFDANGKAV